MKKINVMMTIGAATLFGTVAFATSAQANTNIYRLYNKNTGEHFYTASATERNADVLAGWSYEGTGWVSPSKGTPVYRIYNPNAKGGDHYYTKSRYEANTLVNKGWRWDNNALPVFYSGGNIKVYSAYNPHASSGSHNFTMDSFEQNSLLKMGWKYGQVAWNAVSKPQAKIPQEWSGLYWAGNTTWETGIQIYSDGTFVSDYYSDGNRYHAITIGTVNFSTTPFDGITYKYQIPNGGSPYYNDNSTAVSPENYLKLTTTSSTIPAAYGKKISYMFGIDGNYNYSYSYVRYNSKINGKAIVVNDGSMVYIRYNK